MVFKYGQKCTEQIQSQAQKCLGESTKFDQVVIKRQPRCYQISYSALILLVIGVILVVLCRRYIKDVLEWLQNLDEWVGALLFVIMFTVVSFPRSNYIPRGHCLKVADFFLEEAKLLLSKAIFFSISMVRMADRVYTLHHHHHHLLAFFTANFTG